jgi:hypothetical protein
MSIVKACCYGIDGNEQNANIIIEHPSVTINEQENLGHV